LQEEVNKSTQNVTFTKVNTEKYPKIASQYGVQALPTLVLFKKGRPIKRVEGVLNASDLKRWIDQAVQTS
jgi:thioredoxin-like negative regulator of GroEL